MTRRRAVEERTDRTRGGNGDALPLDEAGAHLPLFPSRVLFPLEGLVQPPPPVPPRLVAGELSTAGSVRENSRKLTI